MLLASNCIPVRDKQIQTLFSLSQQAIHCDVVFGSPSADCRGTGICKITGTNGMFIQSTKKQCRETKAFLTERADKQGITLIFMRSMLCAQLFRHHFWKGILTMQEACELPVALQNQLCTPLIKLLPGKYNVVEASGFFSVDIDCE
jgi:hypothetical protein